MSPAEAASPGPAALCHVRAVLFDLDGTLYRQTMLRLLMAFEMGAADMRSWVTRTVRPSSPVMAFRTAHERVRRMGEHGGSTAAEIRRLASERCGLPVEAVDGFVEEWMFERPLKYLAAARRRGLLELLNALKSRDIKIGMLSDYPVEQKLRALGVESYFSVALCTLDPEINALKPSPRGFLRACELWQLPPEQVLYVGDRPSVDAAGARAAGLPSVIIGRARRRGEFLTVSSFHELRNVLDVTR